MTSFEEIINSLQRQALQSALDRRDFIDKFDTFVKSSDAEDLALLSTLFMSCVTQGKSYASYITGRLDGELASRGLCPSCGRDHVSDGLDEFHMRLDSEGDDLDESEDADMDDQQGSLFDAETSERLERLAQANISDNYRMYEIEQISFNPPLVRCKICGERWADIEERMNAAHSHG